MQSFSLTRSDYLDLQKRIMANAKAQLRRGAGTVSYTQLTLPTSDLV